MRNIAMTTMPPTAARVAATGEPINQVFHAVLRRDRAHDSAENRCHNHGMTEWAEPDVAKNESERPCGETAEVARAGCCRFAGHIVRAAVPVESPVAARAP